MDIFKCDDVVTLSAKRKQKFAGSFARIDSILCELNWYLISYYYYCCNFVSIIAVVIICLIIFFLHGCLDDEIKM